ncbi:MAG: histidine kinase [Pseudomonadota bacterium]
MPKSDNISHLFQLRSASVLLLVYVLTGLAVYSESNGFADWNGAALSSLALMLVFDACYTWSMLAAHTADARALLWLLWIEAVALALLHFTVTEMGMMLSFVAFWIARTPHSYSLRVCSYLLAGVLVFFVAVFHLRGIADPIELLFVSLLAPMVCFFVLSISSTSINLQRERMKGLVLNRELQAAQLQLAQTSRTGERLRIAREIHDLLGHQMTALILNLEVATHKTSGDALTHVERAHALARMLLSDLRNAVSDLRESPALDFDTALAELLANVPELHVTLERGAAVVVHDPHTAEVLLRCIQEALTNTLRHARAKACHIRLYMQDGQFVLDIHDDGTSAARVAPGNGLKGMQERVVALAGSLHWHNEGGSFRLRARLPQLEAQP